MDRQAKLTSAIEIVGRAFKSPEYLQEALQAPFNPNEPTAPRFISSEGNKRLAGVGDKVLALCIVARCYHDNNSTSDTSDQMQKIGDKGRLISKCEASGLANCIAVNNSQRIQGPPPQTKLDAIKGVIGAAYLDGGLDAAKTVIVKLGIFDEQT